MRYTVAHNTLYDYETPVLHGHHWAYLKPRSTPRQTLLAHDVTIHPVPSSSEVLIDYFGNDALHFEVLSPHDRLEVEAHSEVEVHPRPTAEIIDAMAWEQAVALVRQGLAERQILELSYPSPLVRPHASVRHYAEGIFTPGRNLQAAVVDLNQRIHKDFQYETAATDVSTPLTTVMKQRRGVCQDFAHVAVGCLRAVGLPARYVSGYLETQPPPGKERLVGADASHAWAAAYLPGYGWFDFDPTNNVLPSERHITVAWGRDFGDVSPLRGVVLAGGAHRVTVGVDVVRRSAEAQARQQAQQ